MGSKGHIIGIDLTDAMLAQAQKRIKKERWENVTLVQADARDYIAPAGADALIVTYALSLIPECGQLIGNFAAEMKQGTELLIVEKECHYSRRLAGYPGGAGSRSGARASQGVHQAWQPDAHQDW